jgi:hypothetical protein
MAWNRDLPDEPIVAIGLLTESDLRRLGETFNRLWPIDQSTDFAELLQAIDEADERRRLQVPNPAAER